MADPVHDFRTPRPQAATPPPEPLTVVIAEGHGLVRAGFRMLLDRESDVVVAADAATSDEAVAAARTSCPDVVLMDLDLPGAGGIETATRILEAAPPGETRVVMLMTSDSDDAVFAALRAGVTGLLLRDADPTELVAAVRAVAGGDALLAPALARCVVADFVSRPERLRGAPKLLEELTAREREVMTLVACGLNNEEIAERLVVTRATAKTHVSRALCKLHVRDRAQLVILAYEAGIVRPGGRWAQPEPISAGAVVTSVGGRRAGAARRAGWQPLAA